jgi:glycosyltransferase involved in cell wall biosynthesis
MDISVILPVYNEKENIETMVGELQLALDPCDRSYEIIAVDDGSVDGSTQLLKELAISTPALKVVVFRRNCGQTAAFSAGFQHAQGEIIVTIDSDLQNDPQDIPLLISKLEQGFDVVTGWRKNRQDDFFFRRFPSKIANWIIRTITRTKIQDLGCSLKVYRKWVTDELRLYGEMHRFISVIAVSLGAKITEVPVNHRARIAGTSKYGLTRTPKVLLDLTTVWFLGRYQSKPIYIFGGMGVLMLVASLGAALLVLWQRIHQHIGINNNPLFLVVLVFLLIGMQFLSSGILAELIMRTYFESQNKNVFTIASLHGFEDSSSPCADLQALFIKVHILTTSKRCFWRSAIVVQMGKGCGPQLMANGRSRLVIEDWRSLTCPPVASLWAMIR